MRALFIALLFAGCYTNTLGMGDLPDLAAPKGPDPGQVGAACSNDNQCNFGVCLGIGRCSHTCPLPACELGWVCAPEANRNVCQCPTLAAETCNGIDDDCNGIVDDNATCPGGGACVKGQCVCDSPTGNNHLKFVAMQITLPQQRMEFAIDLNGDGKVDNQYGNIVGALTAQNLNPQASVDAQVTNGQVLLLVDEQSSDSLFSNDSCAGALVTNAKPTVGPDFSGNGSFTVDSTVMAGNFAGPIVSSSFFSAAPATATTPVSLQVFLPLFTLATNSPPQLIKLTAAQLKFNRSTGKGQLNGVIRKEDLATANAGVAALLDMRVTADPTSNNSKQILQIFDTGGDMDPTGKCGATCQNPDGSCAQKGDGHIATCEVTTNSIIKNVLNPDVDMFDANGNYAPNPANTDKDSLSVGFAFTAVGAKF